MHRAALVAFAPLAAGLAALVAGVALGWEPGVLETLVRPPALVRAALVAVAVVAGLALVGRSLAGIDASRRPGADRDLATMVRGIRLAFLAVAAFAASAGWVLGHPLPLVIALVIAGVDVVETSFLLLVVGGRRDSGA